MIIGYGGKHLAFLERNRQDNLSRRERLEAEAMRKRAEARSGRGDGRSNLGFVLSKITAEDATAKDDVSGVLDGLRKAAQRAGGSDGLPGRYSTSRDPSFAVSSRSNWSHENGADIAPPLEAEMVGDVSGFRGTARDRQALFSGDGYVGDAMEVLSAEDMRHIASMRWRGRFW